jgi:hypothetical protein
MLMRVSRGFYDQRVSCTDVMQDIPKSRVYRALLNGLTSGSAKTVEIKVSYSSIMHTISKYDS